MLKAVMFESQIRPGLWPVVYLLEKDVCVYTGIMRGPSTVVFADTIIEAICTQEKRDPHSLNFADLRTSRSGVDLQDGQFEYDHVYYKGKAPSRVPDLCPKRVTSTFRHYISAAGARLVQTNEPCPY